LAGGKHEHTLQAFRQRINKVLAEERERRKPAPAPISQEHRELRERIDEAYRALLGSEASESADPAERVFENPEQLATDALRIQDMIFQERKMLEAEGRDWRPFQR
jgi:hypothetical protein